MVNVALRWVSVVVAMELAVSCIRNTLESARIEKCGRVCSRDTATTYRADIARPRHNSKGRCGTDADKLRQKWNVAWGDCHRRIKAQMTRLQGGTDTGVRTYSLLAAKTEWTDPILRTARSWRVCRRQEGLRQHELTLVTHQPC